MNPGPQNTGLGYPTLLSLERIEIWPVGSDVANVRIRAGVSRSNRMHPGASFVVALLGFGLLAQTQDRMLVQPAQQLVADVIYNELNDRGCDSFWQYGILRAPVRRMLIANRSRHPTDPSFAW